MTFKFQAKEEQCYLVHDEETRGWRKPQPQYNKEKVAPTKPKVDSLITMIREHWEQDKRHQPKKLKPINKAKGERRRKSRTPSPKPHRLHRHRKNKEGVVCEESIVRVFHSGTGRAQDQFRKRRSPTHTL
jgi:hypothetical protein